MKSPLSPSKITKQFQAYLSKETISAHLDINYDNPDLENEFSKFEPKIYQLKKNYFLADIPRFSFSFSFLIWPVLFFLVHDTLKQNCIFSIITSFILSYCFIYGIGIYNYFENIVHKLEELRSKNETLKQLYYNTLLRNEYRSINSNLINVYRQFKKSLFKQNSKQISKTHQQLFVQLLQEFQSSKNMVKSTALSLEGNISKSNNEIFLSHSGKLDVQRRNEMETLQFHIELIERKLSEKNDRKRTENILAYVLQLYVLGQILNINKFGNKHSSDTIIKLINANDKNTTSALKGVIALHHVYLLKNEINDKSDNKRQDDLPKKIKEVEKYFDIDFQRAITDSKYRKPTEIINRFKLAISTFDSKSDNPFISDCNKLLKNLKETFDDLC